VLKLDYILSSPGYEVCVTQIKRRNWRK